MPTRHRRRCYRKACAADGGVTAAARPAGGKRRQADRRPRRGRIGAPTGARNKFTSTKSAPAARETAIRPAHRYRTPAPSGNPPARRAAANFAQAPLSCHRGGPHASARGRSGTQRPRVGQQVHIRAAQAAQLAARSPARAISSTISRSRATSTHGSATISESEPGLPGLGLMQPVPARIRQPIRPSSPRAAPGRSRSSATHTTAPPDPARLPGGDRVHHHPAHRGQHAVDPTAPRAGALPARPAPSPAR